MSYEDDLLTINEAARRSGKSIMTIRKYLGLTGLPSKLPNARKILKPGDKQETWAIPFSDLFNAGLMDKIEAGRKQLIDQIQDDKAEFTKQQDQTLEKLLAELLELKVENTSLKRQIELLEANLADLRLMLGRSIETAETQTARRKFWQR